ncbi:hypothetical protein BJ138DRAFT_1182563 [Hygrophoropsis aurantiaca]|uniref:Uncharacterized protein n=1 Tax=Hygrophoropsis aurantiaca TaxID=72124 RepID=A0ACB8A2D0_9AGAM|nr:hypothetical protein BJ138DRAFT_1182563 [Hygrophoropsis aurantiaca]
MRQPSVHTSPAATSPAPPCVTLVPSLCYMSSGSPDPTPVDFTISLPLARRHHHHYPTRSSYHHHYPHAYHRSHLPHRILRASLSRRHIREPSIPTGSTLLMRLTVPPDPPWGGAAGFGTEGRHRQ